MKYRFICLTTIKGVDVCWATRHPIHDIYMYTFNKKEK